jgi:hypothetical protein
VTSCIRQIPTAPGSETAFLEQVAQGTFELVNLTPADLTRMAEPVLRYADFPLGSVSPP